MFYIWLRLQYTLTDAEKENGIVRDLLRFGTRYQSRNITKYRLYFNM